ncbi:GtrA family protein [Streptomyces pyxinae]|uniref:GtrA family protein n=1 Tax=Streptomyces pyxinae TaxID=2970734 RepID=UPI003D163AA1
MAGAAGAGRAPWTAPRAARATELAGFLTAGLAAYAADLALFLWLRGSLGQDPLTAKALAFLAGCTVAYLGNALGPYRRETRGDGGNGGDGGDSSDNGGDGSGIDDSGNGVPGPALAPTRHLLRYGAFFAVNAAGAAVQLGCLALSHYGLGLTSPRADAVSGLGVGMVLATGLRFWGTRTLVFGGSRG